MSRRGRWYLRGLLLLPLVVFFVLIVVTQTFILRSLLVPELEAALNVDVRASRMHVASDGSIVMHDVRVHLPGVDGEPGEFLRMRRLRAWVDWMSLIRGQPAIRRLRPVGAVARFSQDVHDWSLNVESVRLTRRGVGGGGPLPRIDPIWVLVDLGEHDGTRYTPLRLLKLNAAISPDAAGYTVILKEQPDGSGGDAGALALTARIDASGINASLTGMRLETWRAERLPTPIRPFFASLELSGGVSEVSFAYSDTSMEAILHLQGVAMNIPEVSRHDDASSTPPTPLRMSDVHGAIRIRDDGVTADFAGLLEDLPYEVRLRWHGLSLDSGFDVEFATRGFELEGNPRLLPFAPALARYRFESFSRPTASVDAFVTVTRAAPVDGVASDVRQIGRIYFRECSAAYHRFPYFFHEMVGEIEFDDDEVRINSITGTASSGATLRARGRVGPLDETAEVELWIDIDGVPIDAQLAVGLGPQRAEILSELFSDSALSGLVDAGLIRDAREGGGVGGASNKPSVQTSPTAIPFSLGGKVNLRLHLLRHRGEEPHWEQQIRVMMPEVGLVARRFPFPVIGREAVLDIGDQEATLSGGQWRTLGGEPVTISAVVGLHDEAGEADFNPRIEIVADHVAVSDLLIEALPGNDPHQPHAREERGGPTVREIVRGLGPSGNGSAHALIVQRDDGELGFDVRIALAGASIAPAAGGDAADVSATPTTGVMLRDVRGDIIISEHQATFDLLATQDAPHPAADTDSVGAVGGQIRITADATFDSDSLAYSCVIEGSQVNVDARAEDAVRAFSPEFAEEVAAARRELAPRGSLDGSLKISNEGEGSRAIVEIASARNLSFNALGGRVAVSDTSGSMSMSLDGGQSAMFESVRAAIEFDGEPAGEVTAHGTISLAALRDGHTPDLPPTNLTAHLSGGRFESSLPRRIVDRQGPAELAKWWREASPVGEFEHELIVSSPRAGDGPLRADATIIPHTIEFTHEGERVRIVEAFGAIRTSPEGGEFNFDLLRGRGWSLRTSGRWAMHAEGGVSVRARLAADAACEEGMPPDLIALLPRGLRNGINTLDFQSTGIISLDEGQVSYSTWPGGTGVEGDDGEWSAAASGAIEATEFALRAGLDFTQAHATATFDYTREIGATNGALELDITAPRITANGVTMTNMVATILSPQSPTTPGEIIIPQITAATHTGRVSAIAHVRPLGESSQSEYLVEATMADVGFGPLVTELRAAMNTASGRMPQGLLSGRLTLTGIIGEEASRRGAGVLVVGGGEVVTMPLALPLIEASNLALPLGARLDTARADFFIESDLVSFEELSLVSPAVWIWGFGRMTWSTKELDLRFKSRAANRFPILSDLIEGIRNQLVSVRVRGTLGDQQITLEQLPGPVRMVEGLFGRQGSQRRRRLDELEARFDWGRWGDAPSTATDDTIAARSPNPPHPPHRAATQEHESK